MKSPSLTIIKVMLIGLIIGSVLATDNAIKKQAIDPIDIFNSQVIAGYIGYVLPYVLISGLIGALLVFRKISFRLIILDVVGATLCAEFIAGIIIIVVAAVYPIGDHPLKSGKWRDDFIKSAIASCIDKQLSNSTSYMFTKKQIESNCLCEVKGVADLMTRRDLMYFAKYGATPSDLNDQLISLARKCAASH
jgi:L-cystine uptake protein TcyP (sodium:dicarboxylate symporter family)